MSWSSGSGRCSFRASGVGASSQASHSAAVVSSTGMALAWTGRTTSFGAVVRNPKRVCSPSTGFFWVPRVPVHRHQMPAKAKRGRCSSRANQVQTFWPVTGSARSVGSQKEVAGTRQRNCGVSQLRQCGDCTLRILVWPRSMGVLRKAGGVGMPQRAETASRSPSLRRRMIGA